MTYEKNKLILVTGPSGVGKSTVAKKIHDHLSQSFLVDRDVQSRFFGKDRNSETGKITAEYLLKIVDVVLKNKRDIVFDWNMKDIKYREKLKEIAEKNNTDFIEIILFAKKETVVKRCDKRGYPEGISFTREKCEKVWEDFNSLIQKKKALVIRTDNLNESAVFKKVLELIKK